MPKKVSPGKKVSKAAPKTKRISKAKKDIKKNEKKSKIAKPKPKAPKVKTNTKKNGKENHEDLLELGLLLDCSGSMAKWIERAKKTL